MSRVGVAVQRRGQEGEARGGEGNPNPLPAGHVVREEAVGDDRQQHQAARDRRLAFLAATLDGDADSAHSSYDVATLTAFIAIVGTLGILVAVLGSGARRAGVLLGAAAGLLWAASDTSIKALTDHLGSESAAAIIFSPLAAVILAASLVGLLISARSLQIGPAVSVIAVTSVAANALTIAAGPIVFSEPFPDHALGVAVRVLAFALVISAAALTPPPIEAEAQLP